MTNKPPATIGNFPLLKSQRAEDTFKRTAQGPGLTPIQQLAIFFS
jgi:hypothetical protein